jgi:hypothetical protein
VNHLFNIFSISILHLSPGGNAGFDFKQVEVMRSNLNDLINEMFAFGSGSYQGHITFQYVNEIWDFIKPGLAHEFSKPRNPVIGFG